MPPKEKVEKMHRVKQQYLTHFKTCNSKCPQQSINPQTTKYILILGSFFRTWSLLCLNYSHSQSDAKCHLIQVPAFCIKLEMNIIWKLYNFKFLYFRLKIESWDVLCILFCHKIETVHCYLNFLYYKIRQLWSSTFFILKLFLRLLFISFHLYNLIQS